MLNYVWAAMMALGIMWGAFHGSLAEVTNGALESAKEAVALGVTMLGIMSFWTGILKVGEAAGLTEALAGKMYPALRFLFPRIPKGHPSLEPISANMIANMLGLGWAATPAGLRAMAALESLEEERREESEGEKSKESGGKKPEESGGEKPEESRREKSEETKAGSKGGGERGKNGRRRLPPPVPKGTASNEMCTFLVINISSLQLIPVNMIAYRAQYGSANPAAVTGPALLATGVSTLTAVIFCAVMNRRDAGKDP